MRATRPGRLDHVADPTRRIGAFLSALLFGAVGTMTLSARPGAQAHASAVGDPQVMTDHPWYPGELSCSTFERLFATEAARYQATTGRAAAGDEDKALAAWYWRNLNYCHCESPREFYFDAGGEAVREYWAGLFSYGFGLCGTTHAQWTAEMEYLLGHCRGRVVGVTGHNSFEVFLTSGNYGAGDWALLDHDISTVVFDSPTAPARLRSLWNIVYSTPPPTRTARAPADLESILDNTGAPDDNRGWFISGLYYPKSNDDATSSDATGVYTNLRTLEPLAGYAGAPPIVSLKRSETFRRYLKPGLGGSTYCFWGPNYTGDGVPGPDRDRTWVNQPELMYRATQDTPYHVGQGSYGNGVYTYVPDFSGDSYKDGVIDESAGHVTFYFHSPYAVAATPPNANRWGVLEAGCTGGLVVTGTNVGCTVQVSTDNGAGWSATQALTNTLDLTDLAKGHHSYHLRFNAGRSDLAGKNVTMRTVVMCNDRLMPHLKDGGSTVTYLASGGAVFAAGPNRDQAQAHLTSGSFGAGSSLTMTVPAPGGAKILEVYAAAWVSSSNPPDPGVNYSVEYSADGGASWAYILRDWRIELPGYQSNDYWSQSFCFGREDISAANASSVQVRFRNDGGKSYRKAEVHLVYGTANDCGVEVTFNWTDGGGTRTASHSYPAGRTAPDSSWTVPTGTNTVTNWVEFAVEGGPGAETVSPPNAPSGPAICTVGEQATFAASGAASSAGHALEYRFDLGDGTVTAWSASTSVNHAYAAPGTFLVSSQARCAAHGVESAWSSASTVEVETDGDGLPDWWEISYGLDPTELDSDSDGLSDAQEDIDGDGYTNIAEYQNGTDPTVAEAPSDGGGVGVLSCAAAADAGGVRRVHGGVPDASSRAGPALAVLTLVIALARSGTGAPPGLEPGTCGLWRARGPR